MKHLAPIILVILIGVAAGWWIYWAYFNTYHLVTVQRGVLYRDGVRSLHQFEIAVRKTGVNTIVSLIDDREIQQPPFTQEMAYCQAHGLRVVRVPITLGGWPTDGQVKQFLSIATDPQRQPVLVHCAQGVRRTGMMVAAYEMTVLKYSKDQALGAIQTFGHSDRTQDDIRRFIQAYDPVTEKMTETFATSRE